MSSRFSAFAAALPAARHDEATRYAGALSARLDAMIATARTEWPDAVVDEARFLTLLAERLPPELALSDGVEAIRGSDLWIACGCAAGDSRSLAAFDRAFGAEVTGAVRRIGNAQVSADDVAQQVREKLFVGTSEGGRPKILDYKGTGSLRAWLRVTAARVGLNLATRGPKEKPTDDEWFTRVVADDEHPEIAHLKAKYRAEFRSALEAAVGALEPKERNVLAYSFGQRLSIDQIGGIYGVHRATAARWVQAAQERLVEETRAAMMRRLGANEADIDSIVHLIASRFDASLGGILRK
jgi:RNA polymerase sigma-70 factor (ECF subfamily)